MAIPLSLAAPSEVFRLTETLPVKVNMALRIIKSHLTKIQPLQRKPLMLEPVFADFAVGGVRELL